MYASPIKRVVGDRLCGLRNMGNTCYMNGIIQCLASFPLVLNGLLQVVMDEFACVTHPVTSSLRIFLEELQQSDSTYSYDIFLECVRNTWMRYEDRTQQDPMEFYTYLTSTLHGEILEKHCTEQERSILPDDVVNSAYNTWMLSEKSKVTYMFGLQTIRLTYCPCGFDSGVCDNPEFHLSLTLPLGKKTCTLQDCLQLFKQETVITCSQCGEDSARSILRLGRLPPILVIHLVRFSRHGPGFIKNSCKVSYDQTIDLKDISVGDLQGNTKYSVCAVTDHNGQLHRGHVTAYCLRNKRWFHFDDAHVSASSTRRALPESAYILWYQQNLDQSSTDLDTLSESLLKSFSFPLHTVPLTSPAHFEEEGEKHPPSKESPPHPSPSPPLLDRSMASQAMEGEVVIPFPAPERPSPDHNIQLDDTESITLPKDMKIPKLNFAFFNTVSPQLEEDIQFVQPLPKNIDKSSLHNISSAPKRQRVDLDMEDPLLTETDIPGVKIDMNKLDSLKRQPLEKWLRSRNLPVGGNKTDLVNRVRKHHAMGKSGKVDPSFEDGKWHEKKKREAWDKSGVHHDLPIPPMGAKVWKPFPSVRVPEGFSYYKILEYFEDIPTCDFSTKTGVVGVKDDGPVLHVESDSDEEDFQMQASQDLTFTDLCRRAIMSALMKGEQFIASGRVGAMEDTVKNEYYHVKAQVQASMELTLYIVQVCLELETGHILYVNCCCKTQTIHRCGHIAAVLILLWRHVATGNEAVTTTGRVCYWRGGAPGRDPGFVSIKQYASLKWKIDRRNTFNYLPTKLQQQGQMSMEELSKFKSNLRKHIPSSLAMYHIGPLFESPTDIADNVEDHLLAAEHCSRLIWSMNCRGKNKTGPFLLEGTEGQHLSDQWQHERKMRSTAFDSKSFLGLSCDSSKKRYLRQKIWGLDRGETQAMRDGRTLEPQARKLYERELQEAFDPTAIIKETGSWSNTKCPTLSCSPDGLIEADQFLGEVVLFEAKYLSKPHVDPHYFEEYMTKEEAQRFYLQRLPTGVLQLKQTHTYYYQIQMSLDIMEMEWCHLMVYTITGFTIVVVQRNVPFWNEKRLRLIKKNRELVLPEFFLKRTLRHLPPVELVYSIYHEDCDDEYFNSH